MAYSKAKLNINGDNVPPCLKPYLIGNVSDKSTVQWFDTMIDKHVVNLHMFRPFSAIFNQVFNKEKYIDGSYNKYEQ